MKKIILFINKKCRHYYGIEQFLLSKGVAFEERDISEDECAIEQLKEMNIITVPVILIDDNVVIGFQKDKIDELLKKIWRWSEI